MAEVYREIDLYPAVKALLESQGYEVKAEIGPADVMARRGEEPPVIVELKLAFSLALFHQAAERLKITDAVYLAVAHNPGSRFSKALKRNVALARRLGLGVMTVRLEDDHVTVYCDPVPYKPRRAVRRQNQLLREFARRTGDPNAGGQTRSGLTTAYRQDACRIAAHLAQHGVSRGADVAAATGITRATRMMADNHYGWFDRVERGLYELSAAGAAVIEDASAPST